MAAAQQIIRASIPEMRPQGGCRELYVDPSPMTATRILGREPLFAASTTTRSNRAKRCAR
jgi:hypothetical protein